MLLPRAAFLFIALSAPVLAMEAAPDESAEDEHEQDSYIPNRFSITAHGEYAHFNQARDVAGTGGGGLRIGLRVNRWVELQAGADFYQVNLPAHGEDGSVVDLGRMRLWPLHLDVRIDITHIDPVIPWPLEWCRPILIGGLGLSAIDLAEEVDDVVELKYRKWGVNVRGGAGIEFGPPDSRVTFGVEWIYNWVGNDIRVNDPSGNLPSHVRLSYWTIGGYISIRF